MAGYPVKVELMSRFRTQKQQKATVERAAKGEVDIIIGTHRILQKDLAFKKLGLLIIDEEQRFGVSHKERIKEIRNNVDVLTLTATPIPRTLHMSMIGIRDMSLIEHPPKGRFPVSTYVAEYDEGIIDEAIMRELGRGGQVFYLYNRTQTIYKTAAGLSKRFPDANIGVAHAKMDERELEEIILKFLQKEIDVLVCTTIIETGIDIANANTIIIEDADRMGLAQLYQLRGRVGRSNRMAYAYLTYRRSKVLTEVAEKRLRAIKEFTEFGAGFKLALRDLEIRGSGNIIGAQQHGHLEAVGYDLYCKMLAEAVERLRGGGPAVDMVQTKVSLAVNALIPQKYIEKETLRIGMYKRIAAIEGEEDSKDVYDELLDRFGEPPKEVLNLLEIAVMKAAAAKAGICEVAQKGDNVVLYLGEGNAAPLEAISELCVEEKGKVLFSAGNKPYLTIRKVGKDDVAGIVTKILQKINVFAK